MSRSDEVVVWAAWHPQHEFYDPCCGEEGPVAWVDLDSCVRQVRALNREDGTTNRTGWRAVKVTLFKVPA